MIDTQLRAMKARLSKLPKGQEENLLNFLPSNLKEQYKTLTTTQTYYKQDFSRKELLRKIHPSWYEDYMQSLPRSDRSLFTTILLEEKLVLKNSQLTAHLEHFFLSKVFPDEFPSPVNLLADDRMLPLLSKDYKMIGKLCQYLGLYDLYKESKSLIQKEKIQAVQEALEAEELEFLGKVKETSIQMPPIGLQNYDGARNVLRRVMFERGMFRLAKSIESSSDGLKWYISHMIEKIHVPMFLGWCTSLHNEKKQKLIKEETLNTWTYLCDAFPS